MQNVIMFLVCLMVVACYEAPIDVSDGVDDVSVQHRLFNFEEVAVQGEIVSQNSHVVVLDFFVNASSDNEEVHRLSFDVFVEGVPGRKFANLQLFLQEGRDFSLVFSSEVISSVDRTKIEDIVSLAPGESVHFVLEVDVVNDDIGGEEFWFCVYDRVSPGDTFLCGSHFETFYR